MNDTGVQVGVRQTRQIRGVATLTNEDVVGGTKSKSSIARSAWPIELHSGEKPQLKWLLDDYYDISYESFFPVAGEGFVAAGRCLSAEHEAMAPPASRRSASPMVRPSAWRLRCRCERLSPRKLSVSDLRDALRKDGAVI